MTVNDNKVLSRHVHYFYNLKLTISKNNSVFFFVVH